jgi:hypothetical protein
MAGGYIACGSFLGTDKSGSAFQGLLEAVAHFLPAAGARQFRDGVIAPALAPGFSDEQTLTIPAAAVPHLVGPLRRYYDHPGQQLGHPAPHEAPELNKQARLDPVERKWGKGLGWQYYCAHDLLQACEQSQRTGGRGRTRRRSRPWPPFSFAGVEVIAGGPGG